MTGCVYKCFSGDELVYVGQSSNVRRRMAGHMSRSQWTARVTEIEIFTYATRADAMDAEQASIFFEMPFENERVYKSRITPMLEKMKAGEIEDFPWEMRRLGLGIDPVRVPFHNWKSKAFKGFQPTEKPITKGDSDG